MGHDPATAKRYYDFSTQGGVNHALKQSIKRILNKDELSERLTEEQARANKATIQTLYQQEVAEVQEENEGHGKEPQDEHELDLNEENGEQ